MEDLKVAHLMSVLERAEKWAGIYGSIKPDLAQEAMRRV